MVTRRVVPGSSERKAMDALSRELEGRVEKILASKQVEAEVSAQGSVAKDTWLSREADLDIFARLPVEMEREEWTGKILPALRRGLAEYPVVERYAEHPFLEFHVGKVKVNVVPCYAVERGNWKSATDRTPYHTEYMRAKLGPEQRVEARLLKKFMKGVGVYGAEIRTGGFSGMLAETIVVACGSFTHTLEEASEWARRIIVDVEQVIPQKTIRNENRSGSSLIVIDPVDPQRNLAAAVREDKLWSFVAASRAFLKNPATLFFYPPTPPTPTKYQLSKRLKHRRRDFVAVAFNHPELVVDVLWGQLLKLERALVGLLERHNFETIASFVWSDEKKSSVILVQLEDAVLGPTLLHLGPPVARAGESQKFLQKHAMAPSTVKGPWIRVDRWAVEKKREHPMARELIKEAATDPKLGLAVPSQLQYGFRNAAVLVNRNIVSLSGKRGFSENLLSFLDGRPLWLKPSRQ